MAQIIAKSTVGLFQLKVRLAFWSFLCTISDEFKTKNLHSSFSQRARLVFLAPISHFSSFFIATFKLKATFSLPNYKTYSTHMISIVTWVLYAYWVRTAFDCFKQPFFARSLLDLSSRLRAISPKKNVFFGLFAKATLFSFIFRIKRTHKICNNSTIFPFT